MVWQRRRHVLILLRCALPLVAAAGWMPAARPVLAAVGTVATGGPELRLRAGPGTEYDSYGSVPDDQRLVILCQHAGSPVQGTFGRSSLWDQVQGGGWVADADVATGSEAAVAPVCPYAAVTTQNPRSIDQAISWEYQQLGSTADEGWCLRFQTQAFGWTFAGFQTAQDQYQWLQSNDEVSTSGTPPRGALVWYTNDAGTGHVVVSIGAGFVIGTSVAGRVGIVPIAYFSGYEGWSNPIFPQAS
jgi:uncharacterized protein YraI